MNANLRKSIGIAIAPQLSVAHVASVKPFYYVEEAEIKGKAVFVSFYDENAEEWNTQEKPILITSLTDFIDETYGDWINTGYSEDRQADTLTSREYLNENLNQIVTEYLNTGNHVA